jgi:phosphopantothenoylcysteine decarboxylase/phosphopantothenate--cysteine ligase
MGYAVAAAAQARGANVVLVTGPTAIEPPAGIEVVRVRSAEQMRDAILPRAKNVDAIVMTAAVADYRPKEAAANKLKKSDAALTIELIANPDILAELGRTREGARPLLVGFAMETDDVVGYARKKLTGKRVDLMVANAAAVFGRDDTDATLVSADGDEALGATTKRELAERILDRIVAKLAT